MLEFFLTFAYVFAVLFMATIYSSMRIKQNQYYRFFFNGLVLKIVGAICFALVYTFYYGYGDTFEYYTASVRFLDFIYTNPKEGFELLLTNSKYLKETSYYTNSGNGIYVLPGGREMPFYYSADFFLMSKILIPLLIVGFNSYFASTVLIAVVSFTGVWQLYKTLVKISPNQWQELGYILFYIPSIFFWGSGMMKDSITLCAFGFVVSLFYSIFFEKKSIILSSILLVFFSYILLILKGYILLALLPAVFLWLFQSRVKKINNWFFRMLAIPILFVIIFLPMTMVIAELSKSSDKYAFDKLESTAKSYQGWHSDLAKADGGGGSFYSLGEVDYTPFGIMKSIPAALNFTFFRPYLWEVNSVIMGISSLESLIVFLYTIYLMYKIRPFRFYQTIVQNPEILMLCLYSLILGFSVGFTSYNYGALARYKIPCLLTYLVMLAFIKNRAAEKLKLTHDIKHKVFEQTIPK